MEQNIIHVSNDTCLVLDSLTVVCLKCNNLRILCCQNHYCSQETGTGYHSSTLVFTPPVFWRDPCCLSLQISLLWFFIVCFCLCPVSCTICYLCLWIVHSVFFIFLFNVGVCTNVQMFDIFKRNITCWSIMILKSD